MRFIREIFKRNKALGFFGLLNFLVFVILLFLSFWEQRTLLGINIWYKPMKFALSIGIFSWTMAWYLAYIDDLGKIRKIQWTIIVMMFIEQVIITGQAARGELSHFNISSYFNLTLFNIMGTAIFINTLMVFWALLLIRKNINLPEGYRAGLVWGMGIFCIASLQGYAMAANMGHTLGAPDGQEGIFFLNWAKGFIDLRIFHFIGLHALQVLPIYAWFLAKNNPKLVAIVAILYLFLASSTLWTVMI